MKYQKGSWDLIDTLMGKNNRRLFPKLCALDNLFCQRLVFVQEQEASVIKM